MAIKYGNDESVIGTTQSELVVTNTNDSNINSNDTMNTNNSEDIFQEEEIVEEVNNIILGDKILVKKYISREYKNYSDNNFVESDFICGFKDNNEKITFKIELETSDNDFELPISESITIFKNNTKLNESEIVLLERTSLYNTNYVVFQLVLNENANIEVNFNFKNNVVFKTNFKFYANNKVLCGYFDRHDELYKIIENNDITPTNTCKGKIIDIKLYKLPKTVENHGHQICLYIPNDVYVADIINDDIKYDFTYNGIAIPFYEEENTMSFGNITYHIFKTTSYYENDNNGFYDFSINVKINVISK